VSDSDHNNIFHSSTGPATATAGPHKHNILNKLDPRIDSDMDGSKTVGAAPQSKSAASTRYSTASDSTVSTTPASTRTSEIGSMDTYTTVSPGQTSQDPTINPTGYPSHKQTQDDFQEESYHNVSSTDYATGSSASPATTYQSTADQSPTLPASTNPVGYNNDPEAVNPGMTTHTDDVQTGRKVLGPQPEKESIWTAGAVPGPPTEKEVTHNSGLVAHQPTTGLHSEPTESHALATADHEHKGTAQVEHGEVEVKDLGWNAPPDHRPAPLVGGLPNEELWTLIRRFDKVRRPCTHPRES
jgi:hypothetical protein